MSNKFIVYDNTLPRTTNIKCPNVECSSHKNNKKNIVVFHPDPITCELNYHCSTCFTSWNRT